jgi:hypothetical protein
MTFEEAKDQVSRQVYNTKFVFLAQIHERDCLTKAAELYATAKAAQAWEEGYEAMKDQVNDEYRYNNIPNPYKQEDKLLGLGYSNEQREKMK